LQATIEGTWCAALALCHTNKKGDLAAIERLLGSVAFTNFGRSVLLTGRDREETDWFRLVHGKHNLSVKARDLLYRPNHVGDDPRDQRVKLAWRRADADVDVASLFDRPKGDRKASAGDWLYAYLEEGKCLAEQAIAAGERSGHTKEAIEKARRRDPRFGHEKRGFPAQVWWFIK
jgi:hypothetical protein